MRSLTEDQLHLLLNQTVCIEYGIHKGRQGRVRMFVPIGPVGPNTRIFFFENPRCWTILRNIAWERIIFNQEPSSPPENKTPSDSIANPLVGSEGLGVGPSASCPSEDPEPNDDETAPLLG